MFKIEVGYAGLVSRLNFSEKSSADIAYRKLSEAQRNYKKFSNERTEAVEIEHDGGPASLQVEGMITIVFIDISDETAEKMFRKGIDQELMMRRMRADAGLPTDAASAA